MPRPGGPRVQEKSKNFKGSMKRLFTNLKPWKILMILALTLAMISSILALVTPNKLSDLADYIAAGLAPRTENFEKISVEMQKNLDADKMPVKINEVLTSNISDEDKQAFMSAMNDMAQGDTSKLTEIPDSVLKILYEDITIDSVLISVDDQIEMMHLLQEMGTEEKSEKALELMDKLPDSVYLLVKPTMDTEAIKNLAIFMAIIYLLSALFSYIQSVSLTVVSNQFAYKLRKSISTKINALPLKYFDSHETGDILSRITNDIDTIAQNMNNSLSTLVSGITLLAGSVFMMFYTNWIMALTAILSSFLGFFFMFAILGKSQKYFAKSQEALGNLNGYIEENYSGHNVVKAYNGVEEAIDEFSILNNELFEAKSKSIFLSGTMQPMMGFIGNLGYVAVCIVGALLTMNGNISFGVIVAFMMYVRLFTNPLSQIAQAMTNLQSVAAASERVFEFLDEEEMANQKSIVTKLDKKKVKGHIKFDHVKFGYDKKRPIIKDFSAEVKPGEKIAIVGPTGAGKTTMVNLLMKFYEIDGGDILIDGVSTKDLTRENVHELFCMVLQDTWLFDGSIKENIKFNTPHITDNDIMKACETVGVSHFIKTLPGGLKAKITDSDAVSGGQKQLFTIARGMLEDAPFLILDEATSNVDTRTEELVQKAMDKLTKGKTSFIIAHRLSTIKNADLILVMDKGNIVEQGTHEELMKKNGFYADIYNSQFLKINN